MPEPSQPETAVLAVEPIRNAGRDGGGDQAELVAKLQRLPKSTLTAIVEVTAGLAGRKARVAPWCVISIWPFPRPPRTLCEPLARSHSLATCPEWLRPRPACVPTAGVAAGPAASKAKGRPEAALALDHLGRSTQSLFSSCFNLR
jgi:hypothetical protein